MPQPISSSSPRLVCDPTLQSCPDGPPPAAPSTEPPARAATVSLSDSPAAALFRRRTSPTDTGARGAPSSSSPAPPHPAVQTRDPLQCKVATAMISEAIKGNLPLPARVLLAGYVETLKAACDTPPPAPPPVRHDDGAGGAPAER